jgi:SH3-like domain-containing protein
MKKVFILAAVFLSLLQSVIPAEALCVKTARANVRSGPGTQYRQVWQVYKYMPFQKIGISVSGDWYAAKDVDGDIGWMHKKLFTNAFHCAVVRKAAARVRTGPGKHYAQTPWSPAPQYYSFRVMRRKGAWVKVKDEWGQTGWIYRSLLWVQ